MTQIVKYRDLGLKDYKETWDLQEQTLDNLVRAKTGTGDPGASPWLFFVEHPHVYTLGKSGQENNLLIQPPFLEKINATYYRIDRGGDITYHGPGQLVGYPIIDLDRLGFGVKKYIDLLEQSIIDMLGEFSITASRLDHATGVWIENTRKICAIGVRVSRGVTMHGFALNVNTDLAYFNHINPCGFTDKGVTSMEKQTGRPQNMQEVKERLLHHMSIRFGIEISTVA